MSLHWVLLQTRELHVCSLSSARDLSRLPCICKWNRLSWSDQANGINYAKLKAETWRRVSHNVSHGSCTSCLSPSIATSTSSCAPLTFSNLCWFDDWIRSMSGHQPVILWTGLPEQKGAPYKMASEKSLLLQRNLVRLSLALPSGNNISRQTSASHIYALILNERKPQPLAGTCKWHHGAELCFYNHARKTISCANIPNGANQRDDARMHAESGKQGLELLPAARESSSPATWMHCGPRLMSVDVPIWFTWLKVRQVSAPESGVPHKRPAFQIATSVPRHPELGELSTHSAHWNTRFLMPVLGIAESNCIEDACLYGWFPHITSSSNTKQSSVRDEAAPLRAAQTLHTTQAIETTTARQTFRETTFSSHERWLYHGNSKLRQL